MIRFWAYQTYTQGATYWGGVDRVLAAAKATGMKVIPVLEDGPGDCTTSSTATPKAKYQGDTWYSQGYKVPYGNATLSYRDYVARIAAHYADDPTILGWMMMNEADTSARDSAGRSVLVDFATDIAGVIRAADPHHLITVGTQSNGAPGASGPDFAARLRAEVDRLRRGARLGLLGLRRRSRCQAAPAAPRRAPRRRLRDLRRSDRLLLRAREAAGQAPDRRRGRHQGRDRGRARRPEPASCGRRWTPPSAPGRPAT